MKKNTYYHINVDLTCPQNVNSNFQNKISHRAFFAQFSCTPDLDSNGLFRICIVSEFKLFVSKKAWICFSCCCLFLHIWWGTLNTRVFLPSLNVSWFSCRSWGRSFSSAGEFWAARRGSGIRSWELWWMKVSSPSITLRREGECQLTLSFLHLLMAAARCDIFCPTRTSPRANITLSGKKKRKLIKQLRHQQKEKATMEGKECQTFWLTLSLSVFSFSRVLQSVLVCGSGFQTCVVL